MFAYTWNSCRSMFAQYLKLLTKERRPRPLPAKLLNITRKFDATVDRFVNDPHYGGRRSLAAESSWLRYKNESRKERKNYKFLKKVWDAKWHRNNIKESNKKLTLDRISKIVLLPIVICSIMSILAMEVILFIAFIFHHCAVDMQFWGYASLVPSIRK